MAVRPFRFTRDLNRRLDDEAERRGVTPSELCRELVDTGLRRLNEGDIITVSIVLLFCTTLLGLAWWS